jgi:hypothetical protein
VKFKVKENGENNFEIKNFEVIEQTKTRKHLALGIFYTGIAFLIISALYGLKAGNFDALQAIFDNVKIPMATVLGYYFGSKNGSKND